MIREWLRRRRRRAVMRSLDDTVELSRFRAAANSLGSPRGLIWTSVRAIGDLTWVHEANDEATLIALRQVEIEFAADPDFPDEDDMTDAPGLTRTRVATITFRTVNDDWTTDDRVLFNLTPPDIIDRWPGRLIRISAEDLP